MRCFASAAAALALVLGAPGVMAAPPPSPSPRPEPARKRLDLGLFGSSYATAPRDASQNLRFESWVEVIGDPKPSANETMMVWWKHFDFTEPAVYGRGYALNGQPNSVNLLPVFEKIYDKLKKRK
jgi:hypothetical protein